MAELILKKKFKENGIKGIKVNSAGIFAKDGEKMSKNSAYALKRIGINPYNFRSKLLTAETAKKADMLICMTEEHKRMLKGFDNAYTLSEITGTGEVEDPYGMDKETYVKTCEQIERACDEIVKDILK